MPISLMIRLWVDAFLLYFIVGLIIYTLLIWKTRSLKNMPLPERVRCAKIIENDRQAVPAMITRRTRVFRLLILQLFFATLGVVMPVLLISFQILPDDFMWVIVPLFILTLALPGSSWLLRRYQRPLIDHDRQLYQPLALTTQRLITERDHFIQYTMIGWLCFAELANVFWLTIFIKTYIQ